MTHTQTATGPIVIIPAYQPGTSLLSTTSQLLAGRFTVIVVDDGSQPVYQPVFKQLDHRIHLIKHFVNQGKGAALKTGLKYIRRTFQNYIVITADADGQHDVRDITLLAREYHYHSGNLLLGVRMFEQSHVPLRSRLGNVVTRGVFAVLTGQRLSDTQTGLRAFDTSLIDFMIAVPTERFDYEMNVLLACTRNGVPMTEVPIRTIYENKNESSHFKPVRDSLAIYKQVLKFASSSILAFGIDYSLFILLIWLTDSWVLALSLLVANVVSRAVSASVNFTLNKRLVFKHCGDLKQGITRYALLAGSILAGNTIVLQLLTNRLRLAPAAAKIITELTFFALSFAIQKKIIFTRKETLTT